MTDYRHILVDQLDQVATITLNDPGTLNAASFAMVGELIAGLEGVVIPGARAIVLTGAGRGFCSGAKLSDLDPSEPDYDAGAALETVYQPLMRTIRDLSVPIVAAVNGAAAGVGCAIALAGDLILATEDAYFLQAFRRIGLVPDGGSVWLLAHAVGRARTMEMMLLGERIPAQRALEWGLINRVVAKDELAEQAFELASNLANGPTVALRAMREQCWKATEASFDDILALERRQQRVAGRTADHREGIAAFLDKRPAAFIGE